MTQEIYLCNGLRSPFGAFGGALKNLTAPALAAQIIKALQVKNNLQATDIDEVILGQVIQGGTGQAPARQALRQADLSDGTRAMTINKVCGSGLKAIMLAADQIKLGEANLIYAGGMESMSNAPFTMANMRWGKALGNVEAVDLILGDALLDPYTGRHMGELTEDRISEKSITREAQDQYAITSYQRAKAAEIAGLFEEEICPITETHRGKEITHSKDEEPTKVNFEKIPNLRPAFSKTGTITAANASSINDGAAVCLVASAEAVQKHGLTTEAKILAYSQHSQDPNEFSLAPIGAIKNLLEKTGLKISDIGVWEINEAFAAVPLMVAKELDLDLSKVNIDGGAVSLGHPVGASGGRLALHLALELKRSNVKYGIATLCIGGGEAVAMLLERT
ncbi:MAG: thiolase family protein [SAR324 cluster bacterium]|nr:thiolase family protein [SAR324 cluster bacterium]